MTSLLLQLLCALGWTVTGVMLIGAGPGVDRLAT
jgi:hypothetical protein